MCFTNLRKLSQRPPVSIPQSLDDIVTQEQKSEIEELARRIEKLRITRKAPISPAAQICKASNRKRKFNHEPLSGSKDIKIDRPPMSLKKRCNGLTRFEERENGRDQAPALVPRNLRATTFSEEALKRHFTLFPQLPTEIRFMIWKKALPMQMDKDGRRIFTVNCHPSRSIDDPRGFQSLNGLEMGFQIAKQNIPYVFDNPRYFLYPEQGKQGKRKKNRPKENQPEQNQRSPLILHNTELFGPWTSAENFDIGISRTCHESREIYLHTFQYELPSFRESGHLVRFDADATIHICNSWYLKRFIADFNRSKSVLPRAFSRIKHLSVDVSLINFQVTFSEPFRKLMGRYLHRGGGFQVILQFPALETLSVCLPPLTPPDHCWQRVVEVLKGRLEKYKRGLESDAKFIVPKIHLIGG